MEVIILEVDEEGAQLLEGSHLRHEVFKVSMDSGEIKAKVIG